MRRRRLGLLLLISAGLLLQADLAHGSPTFKSEAQVAGDYITLSNLADLPPELAQKCGSALVWSAPPPGQIYTLTQEFLKYRLGQMGLSQYFQEASLPMAIQVRQTGVLLKGEDVAETFRRYVQTHNPYPSDNLHIEVFPLKEPIILPDAQVTLKALHPIEAPTSVVVLREEIYRRIQEENLQAAGTRDIDVKEVAQLWRRD